MPYRIEHTDKNNKPAITVYDNTSNFETSLEFPGRNKTGYGQIIAENFLHLLENFASGAKPVNPVEGQLWYDSDNGLLMLNDGTGTDGWKAASGIQKGPTEPAIDESKVGELWIDTTNQQLRIFSGTRWILVGPNESSVDGLRYGPTIERIADSDNTTRAILTFYIADIPVIIFSKDTFTPKITLTGFPIIKAGININVPSSTELTNFKGGLIPKLYGVAEAADALVVVDASGNSTTVESGKFLRSDSPNTTDYGLNIANNSGITLGVDRTFQLLTTATSARIYNKATGSSIDLQTNRAGQPSTILRVIDDKVGINNETPDEALDVDGNIRLNGKILITGVEESTNLNNGSFQTAGGMAITKNLRIGTDLDVDGTTTLTTLRPKTNELYDCGTVTHRWNYVRAKTVVADVIRGTLDGDLSGIANSARTLVNDTSFKITGDVISPTIRFRGDGTPVTFETELTANIISGKSEPFPIVSKENDYVLTYRASAASSTSSGLFKQKRDTFIGDLGVPMGAIMPFAGTNAPYGYLLCDGSEVEIAKYQALYDVIGTTYNGITPLVGFNTFRLPDLRARFPLGRDTMDNGGSVPLSTGSYVDAGGGTTGRVPGTKAQTLGGEAGQSSVELTLENIPEHSHTMQNKGIQYAAIRVDTAINPPASTGLGPTAPGQAQYFNNTGGVKTPDSTFELGQPVGIMNPYLTINYIIRSGPPAFTTTTG